MTQMSDDTRALRAALLELAKEEGVTEERFDAMCDALSKGATIGDVSGVSKEALESGYALAYNLYKAGNYDDAEKMFKGLCIYDNTDSRFWMGLGGCRQARGDYLMAAETYGMAAIQSAMQDPQPFLYAGVCKLKAGHTQEALDIFDAALSLGEDGNPAHKACHDRIAALVDTLKKAQQGA